jgi:AmiR/NasT family two-component response regulator
MCPYSQERTPEAGHLRHLTVLIADDEAVVRLDLKSLMTELGHTVVGEADTGAKALALAKNLRPDLVLLDISMPPVSGLDVADALAAEQIAPSLVFTGVAMEEALERVGRSGAMGFLCKPLRTGDIGPLMQIAVARWNKILELEAEIKLLNERMEARKLVGRAKAILMERFNLPERDAFKRIQAQSASLNKPVHEIARAIITAHDVSG